MSATVHPLERHRVAVGLSQVEAAELAGLNVKTLRNAEHGHAQPRLENVTKLAKVYGVDPAELLAELRAARPAA